MSLFITLFPMTLVQDVGYEYGKLIFTEWRRGDVIEKMLQDNSSPEIDQPHQGGVSMKS